MPRKHVVHIDTSPVSDAYSDRRYERRIEFSAYRTDVAENGSYNTLMGGLINFIVIRADGDDVPEDKLIVSIYRTDPNVEVRLGTVRRAGPSLGDLADDLDQIAADILAVDESNDPIESIGRIAQELRKRQEG